MNRSVRYDLNASSGNAPEFSGSQTKPLRIVPSAPARPFVEMPASQIAARKVPALESKPDQLGRHRILLVEDEPITQMIGERMLSKLGYSVRVASNGEEAVKAAMEERFDVILMDVQMPKVNGLEATREIRSLLPTNDQPRIIALTSHDDRNACLAAGMDDYIRKPARIASLRYALI